MSFTFWTVRVDFFGNVHALSLFGFAIEKTFALLYFFRFEARSLVLTADYSPSLYSLEDAVASRGFHHGFG